MVDLHPKISESLAGRMEVLALAPFSQGEIVGRREGFVDACFAREFKPGTFRDAGWPALVERIVRGGFPEALARADAARRSAWFGSYITTILERDVRDLSNVQNLSDLSRLLRLLAARTSGVLNLTDVARDAHLPLTTLQRHWALLEAVFDTGLLCHLLNLDAERLKTDDLMSGSVLESFVAVELGRQATWSRVRPALFHYRTQKQQAVDLVMEDGRGRLVGIEVKKTASPTSGDFKGLRHLSEHTGKRSVRGILLYTGSTSVAFGPNLHAVPVSALWQLEAGSAEP